LLSKYSYVGIYLVFCIGFPVLALGFSWLVRARGKSKNPIKYYTFECGMETVGPTWIQYNVRYYLYALIFVIFDIETVFLYPWAVRFNQLGLFAMVEVVIFVAILLVGYAYAWKKRALEWK
jgi:NADH:ubiquinone oxidoreductase subunit 3 (subunit A)